MGNIGLRLVVVVVADEVLHGVVGKELLELRAELGRQGLVVGQDQRGPLDGLNDLGHGEGLAGAGNAQEDLFLQPVLDARRQGGDGLRLVAGGLVFGYDLEFRHGDLLSAGFVVKIVGIIPRKQPDYNICSIYFLEISAGLFS